jgi:hypothetical protein
VGKPKDPNYWRKYRASHPRYQERERERSRKRRVNGNRGNRATEYRNRSEKRQRANGNNGPAANLTHPVIEQARGLVSLYAKPDGRTLYDDTVYDDAVMETVVAILEGADPEGAAYAAVREAREHAHHLAPLLDEGLTNGPEVF